MTKVAFGFSMTLALGVGLVAGRHHEVCGPRGLPRDVSQLARVGKLALDPAPSVTRVPCAAGPSSKDSGNFSLASIEAEEMRAQQQTEFLGRRAAAEYSSNEIDAAGKDLGATQAAIQPTQRATGGWPAGSVEAEELGARQRAELAAAEAKDEYSSDLKVVGIPSGAKAP